MLNIFKNLKLSKNILIPLFFITYLISGLIIASDYGISWDEPISRINGIVSVNYVFSGDDYLFDYIDKDYGVIIEMPLVLAERYLGFLDNIHDLYIMRHLCTFLTFYVGVVFFFLLVKNHFNNHWFSLLGSTMLILSPRIFAQSFYNSKDIPFLSLFIISIYLLIKYLQSRKIINLVFLAIASAFLIDVRIIGLLIPFFSLTFLFFAPTEKNSSEISVKVIHSVVYLIIMSIVVFIFWPYLRQQPITHLITAWQRMSKFPWPETVLFGGHYLSSAEIPRYYVLTWIGITTPIIYLLTSIIGAIGILLNIIKNPYIYFKKNHTSFLFLLWVYLPLLMVNILGSILYDDWRHLYFIYPGMIILALLGIQYLWNYFAKKSIFRILMCVLLILNMGNTFWFMLKSHPNQQVYFNELVGNYENAKKNFDFDYWGLSFKQGLEYIITHDKRDKIVLYTKQRVAKYNADALPNDQKERIYFTDNINEADYYVTNYRWDSEEYKNYNEVFNVSVNGAKLMGVYKL